MKLNLKEEKGSVTMFVVAVMIFVVTILGITYINVLNKLSAEDKKINKIQNEYGSQNIEEEYQRALEQQNKKNEETTVKTKSSDTIDDNEENIKTNTVKNSSTNKTANTTTNTESKSNTNISNTVETE